MFSLINNFWTFSIVLLILGIVLSNKFSDSVSTLYYIMKAAEGDENTLNFPSYLRFYFVHCYHWRFNLWFTFASNTINLFSVITCLIFRQLWCQHKRKFSVAHVCKITFKHLPQPLKSHTGSFRTLGQLLKIPLFVCPNIA